MGRGDMEDVMKEWEAGVAHEEGWYRHKDVFNGDLYCSYWSPPFHRVYINNECVQVWMGRGDRFDWETVDVSHCKDIEEIKDLALTMWRMQ